MPKYDANMRTLLIGDAFNSWDIIEALKKTKITEVEIIEALKQIVSGMIFLKANSIYHADIGFHNVLCVQGKKQTRYDIIDFGSSKDLTVINSINLLYKQLGITQKQEFDQLSQNTSSLSEVEFLDLCKDRYFYSYDAAMFRQELEEIVMHLVKTERRLVIIKEIIANIKFTQSIDGVLAKLQKM
jgi:serine/threonine protein kinase